MVVMTPLQHYQQDLQRPDFFHDPVQEMAVTALQDVYDRVLASRESRGGLFARWKKVEPVVGLYMWGGVGRGKTYLMDVFYEALPFEEKKRIHFHRFMQQVHREMRARQGEKDPLKAIANEMAKEFQVLCFDEFFVTDITDAMILATLLQYLFEQGITLVTTSNIVPDGLYKDGLQRDRFLPAIALLNQYTKVMNVDGGTDYRLRLLTQAELFHCPLGDAADRFMIERFSTLETEHGGHQEGLDILIEGRAIAVQKLCDDVVWFDFRDLCDGPRSQNDYIEIAREYHTVLLSDVERMGVATDDIARRFINLIDEFYDRAVKLIITAEVPIEDLYAGGRLEFEFERTRSRLQEMQSHEYLALPHLP